MDSPKLKGVDFLDRDLAELEQRGLLRTDDPDVRRHAEAAAARRGVALIDASSNDYLGYGRAAVSRATLEALGAHSPGAGASRLIHGTADPIPALEAELASWVAQPQALLFSSGYAANLGVVAALARGGGLVVSDALNHASLIDGCRLGRARVVVVPHLDLDAVTAALRAAPEQRRIVLTESYFSMDGDSPDLATLRAICDEHGALLVVDEAHALGVFGPEGAGRLREREVRADVTIGTLGKAIGVQGAFVAGTTVLRSYLWNRARSFVFSTGVSPLLAALIRVHVERARADEPARSRVLGHARRLRGRLGVRGEGPIIPIEFGDPTRAGRAADRLRELGILAQAIRPPTVPSGARLRVTVSAAMTEADVERLADALEHTCGASSS
jgi:8-amino-7-oxononanoate synthase